jgi:hypothetical protein
MQIRIDGGVVVAWSAAGDERSTASMTTGAGRAWDNWASRDWAERTVEQFIPPDFPTRKR